MKKKIILLMLLCILMLLTLSVTSCAFEVPAEYEGTNYGASFDTSHDECCAPSGSGEINHYEKGYQDGFGDGLASSAITDEEKQAIIDEFKASQEYQDALEGSRLSGYSLGTQEGVEEYKKSDEYNSAMQNQYQAGNTDGYNSGYAEGAAEMYAKGVADGFANFKTTNEYKNTVEVQWQEGYIEGHDKGYELGVDNQYNPATVIGLVVVMLVGFSLLFVLTMRKKGRK